MTAVEQTGDNHSVNVRVSTKKSKFLYVDFAKHRLHESASEIVISGLGLAITEAVSVAEMLKSKGLCVVSRIRTSRGEVEQHRKNFLDKIEITVVKAPDFDAVYEQQEQERAMRATTRTGNPAADAGENDGDH